jgi:hypothetical protein
MKELTFSRIKQILFSCAFKPSDKGPFHVICDVGNPLYYQQRACEIIKTNTGNTQSLRTAISLLALAIAEIELNDNYRENPA